MSERECKKEMVIYIFCLSDAKTISKVNSLSPSPSLSFSVNKPFRTESNIIKSNLDFSMHGPLASGSG